LATVQDQLVFEGSVYFFGKLHGHQLQLGYIQQGSQRNVL